MAPPLVVDYEPENDELALLGVGGEEEEEEAVGGSGGEEEGGGGSGAAAARKQKVGAVAGAPGSCCSLVWPGLAWLRCGIYRHLWEAALLACLGPGLEASWNRNRSSWQARQTECCPL